ncbi:MAG: cupin domain-containing protein [Saprospiraceae bacterium]|nr:cupin domain-containing protein [Saprospiraceae bacterium]
MAHHNKRIENPYSGQSIVFLKTAHETQGELLEMEYTYAPHSAKPAEHYHPIQKEDFTVLQGVITVTLNGATRLLRAGDKLHIPPNTVHAMWNDSDEPAVVNWQVRPALNTEYLLETGMGLAKDGKTNKKGLPGLLQAIAIARYFSKAYRLANPPYAVQRVLFAFLGPVAKMLGYRATYQEYID